MATLLCYGVWFYDSLFPPPPLLYHQRKLFFVLRDFVIVMILLKQDHVLYDKVPRKVRSSNLPYTMLK